VVEDFEAGGTSEDKVTTEEALTEEQLLRLVFEEEDFLGK